MKKTKSLEFGIPPHANEEIHRKLMKRFKEMTQEERTQTLIDAGIVTVSTTRVGGFGSTSG